MKRKIEFGDVVFDTHYNELGIICGVFKNRGCVTTYNIEVNYIPAKNGFYQNDIHVGCFDIEDNLVLISKGDFK